MTSLAGVNRQACSHGMTVPSARESLCFNEKASDKDPVDIQR